jgi:purine-nucleoside phosphorylase
MNQHLKSTITSAEKYLNYIIKHRNLKMPQIPETCIITHSNRLIQKAKQLFKFYVIDIGSIKPTEIYFFKSGYGRDFAIVGEQHGAPMAVVLIEELIALGFNTFISIGSAGHPTKNDHPTIEIGDIILVKDSFICEGTSSHYDHYKKISMSNSYIYNHIKKLFIDNDISFHEGRIATTDAIYRETIEFIEKVIKKNCLALDMETSALYTVCNFYKKKIVAILYISDILNVKNFWDVQIGSDNVEKTEDQILNVILKFLGII